MKIAGLMLLAVLSGGSLLAQQPPRQNPPARRASPVQEQKNTPSGGQLFQTHCGRCHQPPMGLSPKAVPTVLRHMRVRALLPADQEKRLLQFLAP